MKKFNSLYVERYFMRLSKRKLQTITGLSMNKSYIEFDNLGYLKVVSNLAKPAWYASKQILSFNLSKGEVENS